MTLTQARSTVHRFIACALAACALLFLASTCPASLAQQQTFTAMPLDSGFGPLDPSQPAGITPQQIIDKFAARETEFKRALDQYTYQRTVKVETINDDNKVDGEYMEVDDIVFSPSGEKSEKAVYAPGSTLTRIMMSPADFDDIEHRLPYTLTADQIGQYNLTYVGKQRIDELDTYAFDVAPKVMEKNHRYFKGRIWVDTHDYQIVVTNGKNVPDNTRRGQEDLSPPFTTYRQQIDGQYWFPVYTKGEGILHFDGGRGAIPQDVHIREIVKYEDYKKFGANIRIIYKGQDISNGAKQPNPASPTPAGQSPAPAQPTTGSTPPPATKH